ncbi:hypothetical protein P879_10955 [Paragonimus westermani]|uniref:Uncharacterized protein n=1 Tax=Paragonimus westermani TaxID=34504 RepID=A0A8T0DJA2_9TREM|nr:hypothetical protein P879_10955 [Paragonimus westermani]
MKTRNLLSAVVTNQGKVRCARDISCRSMYYNGLSGECFRAMYADSLLDENLPKREIGWTRFVKTAMPNSP